ncbi:hypothetical protein DH2020_011368 [Rehmannia glutinosa]|uniref:S-locus receptor kinase C-terminal domain-containing protein n=1 Tax=Rehmannia glutinosa TaxID=99300 RepID=A0ABR0XD63_REHGL
MEQAVDLMLHQLQMYAYELPSKHAGKAAIIVQRISVRSKLQATKPSNCSWALTYNPLHDLSKIPRLSRIKNRPHLIKVLGRLNWTAERGQDEVQKLFTQFRVGMAEQTDPRGAVVRPDSDYVRIQTKQQAIGVHCTFQLYLSLLLPVHRHSTRTYDLTVCGFRVVFPINTNQSKWICKSDVFSFGVLVLEIVSGKRNRGFFSSNHKLNLLGHAWTLCKEENLISLVDPSLGGSFDVSEVLRSIQVGLLCVQKCPDNRPSMSSVVFMLGNDVTLPRAKQPGFFTERDVAAADDDDESLTNTNAANSVNEVTITWPDGR